MGRAGAWPRLGGLARARACGRRPCLPFRAQCGPRACALWARGSTLNPEPHGRYGCGALGRAGAAVQVTQQLRDLDLGDLMDTPPPGVDEAVAISKVRLRRG